MTSEAQVRHETAQRAVTKAAKALDDAEAVVTAMEASLDDGKAKPDAVVRAIVVRDSAARVLAKRKEEQDAAAADVEAETRAVHRTELTALRAKLATWRQEIAPTIAKVLEHDAQLADLFLDLGVLAGDAEELYLHALDLAHGLNEETKSLDKPSLAEARLELGKALTRDRAERARFDQSSWLASADTSWQLRSATAEERLKIEAKTAQVRHLDELAAARDVGIQLGINAARAAQQQQQKTGEQKT
jgi:hypothetical protein